MSDDTANLQSGNKSRLTVKQAAILMNVSERTIYMARELKRTGREDLVTAVEQGKMSLHAALKLARPKRYAKSKYARSALMSAWAAAVGARAA